MMWPIGCPETSAINYHYSLRNNLEQRSPRVKNFYSLFLTLEVVADRLSRNVGKELHYSLSNNPEERSPRVKNFYSLFFTLKDVADR